MIRQLTCASELDRRKRGKQLVIAVHTVPEGGIDHTRAVGDGPWQELNPERESQLRRADLILPIDAFDRRRALVEAEKDGATFRG